MKHIFQIVKENVIYFLKWGLISGVIGIVVGLIGSLFGHGVIFVTKFWNDHLWTIYFMPLAGCIIIWLYRTFNEEKNRGTNMVISAISSDEKITIRTAPLIFLATILTHAVGGSSGREGAALQLGGSLGSGIGSLIKLDEKDKKIAVMCGMSACFSALFGTPLAAGFFSMEVISIGVIYYAALVPCLFSSFIGAAIAGKSGLIPDTYKIALIPSFSLKSATIIVLLGVLSALVSIAFCIILHESEAIYRSCFKNPYIRIIVASIIFIAITFIVGNRDYNGGGFPLIEKAMEGDIKYEAFLMKMLFTAVALGAGFKGGEIVPTLCVGATFGCAFGNIYGFSPSLCAACGMMAVFVGVTNCPITTMFLAFEVFGFEAMPFFSIVVAVSFTLSGYFGLYQSQKFIYSKTKTEYINKNTYQMSRKKP